jgi:hypothetical protein
MGDLGQALRSEETREATWCLDGEGKKMGTSTASACGFS